MGSSDEKIYRIMGMCGHGWPFITECPACDNREKCKWVHASDDGLQTIDRDGDIHCYKCSMCTFLMDLRYDCGKHNDSFKDPNFIRICDAIAHLANCGDLPDDVCEKIIKKIVDRRFR